MIERREIEMELVPDWALLWRQIVQKHKGAKETFSCKQRDAWANKARSFNDRVSKRWDKPDSSRDFIVKILQANPGSSVLDIGAGTGAWACKLAPYARTVTALEPSSSMIAVMKENIEKNGISNIQIIQEAWPDAAVEDHDFSLCSHAMYGCPDVKDFFHRMNAVTRMTCILLMRVTTPDGLMAGIARHIWGQPHDSPNFHIGYNALLQMGIYPNVLMEDRGLWDPWTNTSLEAAVEEVKRKLGIEGTVTHDAYLFEILGRYLKLQDGCYVWPKGVRSALVYWNPQQM